MKALRKTKPGKGTRCDDVGIPQISESDLLVRVKATALCKSDIDVCEWTPLVAKANYKLPFIMGHEFLGRVVEVGKYVKNFQVGDHVAGETHTPCGYCYVCRTGNRHICANNMGILGRTIDGSFAEYIRLPDVSAIKMDKSIPAAQGALMEPLGTALYAVTKANVSGRPIAILGCGTIGLMAVELSKLLGATKVIAVDCVDRKLEEATKYGADLVINSMNVDMAEAVMDATSGAGIDAAVDTTGNQKVINQIMQILRIAGTCVFVGMIDYPLVFDEFMNRVVYKELNLTGIFGRRMYETWETLAGILESGRIDLAHYVAAELPLGEFEKALELFPTVSGRVVLYP